MRLWPVECWSLEAGSRRLGVGSISRPGSVQDLDKHSLCYTGRISEPLLLQVQVTFPVLHARHVETSGTILICTPCNTRLEGQSHR